MATLASMISSCLENIEQERIDKERAKEFHLRVGFDPKYIPEMVGRPIYAYRWVDIDKDEPVDVGTITDIDLDGWAKVEWSLPTTDLYRKIKLMRYMAVYAPNRLLPVHYIATYRQ